MYSLLRIGNLDESDISGIITAFNQIIPDFCADTENAKTLRVADVCNFSLSHKTPWYDNCNEIQEILQKLKPVLEYARNCNAEMEIDTAIYQCDYHGRNMTMFVTPPCMLELLAELKITLTFTLYTIGIDWSKNPLMKKNDGTE